MWQKDPIWAPLQSGVQSREIFPKIEFYPDIASTPKEVAISEGLFVAGYDEGGNLKGVRMIVLDTAKEKKLFKEGNFDELTNIYRHNLQFRA